MALCCPNFQWTFWWVCARKGCWPWHQGQCRWKWGCQGENCFPPPDFGQNRNKTFSFKRNPTRFGDLTMALRALMNCKAVRDFFKNEKWKTTLSHKGPKSFQEPPHLHFSPRCTKVGLISKGFSLWLKSPKNGAKSRSWELSQDCHLAPLFGDLSQSEKLQPPL